MIPGALVNSNAGRVCDRCGSPCKVPPGLAFSPPSRKGRVQGHTVCAGCWKHFELWLRMREGAMGDPYARAAA